MSGDRVDPSPPRTVLVAALVLIAAALLLTAAALREPALRSGVQTPQAASAAIVGQARLRFIDQPDGSVAVLRDGDAAPFTSLEPGSNGFIRGVLRGMVRERRLREVTPDHRHPFIVTLRVDGSLTVEDSATGRLVDLRAFGPTNAGAFERLLELADPPGGRQVAAALADAR